MKRFLVKLKNQHKNTELLDIIEKIIYKLKT